MLTVISYLVVLFVGFLVGLAVHSAGWLNATNCIWCKLWGKCKIDLTGEDRTIDPT